MAKRTTHEEGRFRHFIERVDDRLFPAFGSPHVGPYDEEVQNADLTCPVCGHEMSEHIIDHSTPNALLECPVATPPVEKSTAPLDEVGMPTDRARAKADRHAKRQEHAVDAGGTRNRSPEGG